MTKTETSLTIFTEAAKMLAKADTIQKAHELRNLALTAAEWAKRKGMGEEAVRYARSYALDAERKMGEMLGDTARANTARDKKKAELPGVTPPPTLVEIGVSKRESADAQRLAALPDPAYKEVREGKKTRTAAIREQRREEASTVEAAPLTGKYRVIYADPPWKYGDQLTESYGAARFHYSDMSIAELCELPVRDIAEDNAVMFLWVTSPMLAECWPVIRAWGFKYKASFVWDKVLHNMGHYNSVRHEFLLICTRGSCLPDTRKLADSVISIERTKRHSEKPDAFRKLIDAMYPNGPRVELFARHSADGWDRWGDQA